MVATTTLVLALVAVGAVVWVLGVDRTQQAAGSAAGTARSAAGTASRAARSGIGLGIMGFVGGVEIANQLLQTAMMEPFAVTTILAGVMGALGIEGLLGGITGVQFLLIGFTVFVAVWMLKEM